LDVKPRTERARALRRLSTNAEHRLWSLLRARQVGGAKFRRQVPIGRYIADFACFDAKLVVELDGAAHDGRLEYDLQRTRDLEALGWHVIRFGNEAVYEDLDSVGRAILAELKLARP
jgi:very-short-patch-repair endonuclease